MEEASSVMSACQAMFSENWDSETPTSGLALLSLMAYPLTILGL